MMYEDVPLVADVQLGAVAGTATTAIIGAPGATKRLRIVGGHIGGNRAAGLAIDCVLTGGGPTLRLGSMQDTSTSSTPIVIPPPGYVLALNTAATFQVSSTAATGAGTLTLFYFIDDFT